MFNRQSLHIALLMWGCVFCLIATLCMLMSKNFNKEKRKWLLLMQLSCAILLGSDAVAWAFRGYSGNVGFWVVKISNFLVFLYSDIVLMMYHGYVCCYLFEKHPEQKKRLWINAVYAICTLGVLLVVISQFTNLYYSIDEQNFYQRNSAYILSMIIPVCGMLLDLGLLIRYRRNVSREMLVAMISYEILLFVAVIVQAFYYGVSLINLAICISMILIFVSAMVEQNRELAIKQEEAADLRVQLMLSQIKPHFIYNALTVIQRLCIKDPKMAQETVAEFATYLRGNLESLDRKVPVYFEKELEHVQCYLAIEKKRFGDRVKVVYDIQEEDFVIPALTLQPLVENSVKHGICKKEEGGTVWISTERKKDVVYVIVKDNGVGFEKSQTEGKEHVGIQNVESRLHSMCDGMLEIESTMGKGTIAVITLPQRDGKTKSSEEEEI